MKSITDDILEWSEKYIEPKNEHLGVSVCPYAKRARLENKYKILECHNFAHFQDTIIEGAKLAKDPDTNSYRWLRRYRIRTRTTFICN